MPTLPLPTISPLAGGDLPVTTDDDILQILPAFLKPHDPPPIRDAIIAALREMMLKYQQDSTEAVLMHSVLYSVGSALRGLGEDRGFFQGEEETEEVYRARILSIPDIVTPTAIVKAVNAILAPYTTVECQYSESVQDRWYVGNGTGWHSYVFDDTTSLSPGYPARLYEYAAASHMGYFRPNSNPGGARLYSDCIGRLFMIRIPLIANFEDLGAFINSTAIASRFYVGGVGVSSPIRVSGTTAIDTFNNIISAVNRIKGQSIRWILYSDPKLK